MTKTQRLMHPQLLALSMIFALGAEARNTDSLRWAPEWGVELITEQQVTTEGRYRSATEGDAFIRKNFANLLRLQASLPIACGFSLDVGSISTFMTARESIGGDLQTFSNLDAPRIPFALSVCGVNWNLPPVGGIEGGRHSLFLGIRNMNEDYFCSPVTSLFTNSSCGIFPTISANYDIANYPVASVGVHYRYGPSPSPNGPTPCPSLRGRGVDTNASDSRSDDEVTSPLPPREGQGEGLLGLQASLYNGIGSYHFIGRDNMFRFCPKNDGLFGLAEVSYRRRGSCYFVGNAVYWGGSSSNNIKGVSLSPWAYAEQRITDRLSLIAGYSHAFGDEATCRDFAGLGGRYAWDRAELGLFTDYANFAEGDEFATELTCKIDLMPYLFLQPSLHAIFMPDDDNLFHGAGTLRLGVTF